MDPQNVGSNWRVASYGMLELEIHLVPRAGHSPMILFKLGKYKRLNRFRDAFPAGVSSAAPAPRFNLTSDIYIPRVNCNSQDCELGVSVQERK